LEKIIKYNFIPELVSKNIYDCPFFEYCPKKVCLEEGIEKCLILERASFRNKSEKEENIQENFGEYWEFLFN
jgi:hypothetical protein